MRFGNYTLLIENGLERESGYVGLKHGEQYAVRLGNADNRRCVARVTIDGKPVGNFVLNPHEMARIERSVDDAGKFTFYAVDTEESVAAGQADISHYDRGLVQVEFVPEKYAMPRPTAVKTTGLLRSRGPGGQSVGGGMSMFGEPPLAESDVKTSGGITGLSGHSGQQFVTVASPDLDEANAVKINLRLVLRDDGPRKLRPVAVAGNPVPPPV